ncbi:MAG TPA: D-glycero-beta-D-manno-heptose 1-phosphate adenylyltransferase [Chitinophagaceae bacterium]|nr:D-glycero-beta-D-manno-heptose 1-phosphate adenylyltransferase [Chitinophagaceae bacterium]
MKNTAFPAHKILTITQLLPFLAAARLLGKTIAFTNGCYDILHEGHIYSLSKAAAEADLLVVGVNADESVKKLKGEGRPVNNQHSRALVLASLIITDAIVIFEEDTPLNLINIVKPNVLVKGGDYTLEQIVGAKEVMENGGRVVINPIIPNFSTTGIIDRIKSRK